MGVRRVILMAWLAAWFLTLAVLCSSPASAQVRIVQVLYDPLRTDAGGEFVQLENDGARTVDIGGWSLATGSSLRDVVFPANLSIPARGSLLVADTGWNGSRDNLSWPLADLEASMTLSNSNSGVALLMNGSAVDAVGWGNVSNQLLYQGTPAKPVKEGMALRRVASTGSNDQDFVAGLPSFYQALQASAEIVVNILEPVQSSGSWTVQVEDDEQAPGVQLAPFPGAVRLVNVSVTAPNSTPDTMIATAWAKNASLTLKGGVFAGELPLPYYTISGNYTITVKGWKNGGVVGEVNMTAAVLPVLSISLDASRIQVGDALPGSTVLVKGDDQVGTLESPTVWNSGNVPGRLSVLTSDLVGQGQAISSENMHVAVRRSGILLPEADIDVGVILGVRETAGLDLSLDVPQGPKGQYVGRLWLVASQG